VKLIRINKYRRPLKWVIQDALLTVLTRTVELVEALLTLLTLEYFTIMVSDAIDIWNLKRQLKRRKRK
jgi:hypothetical protein